jgi:hypothetical protein
MKRFDTVEQVAKEMNLPVEKVQGTFNKYMDIVKDPKTDPFGKKLYVSRARSCAVRPFGLSLILSLSLCATASTTLTGPTTLVLSTSRS